MRSRFAAVCVLFAAAVCVATDSRGTGPARTQLDVLAKEIRSGRAEPALAALDQGIASNDAELALRARALKVEALVRLERWEEAARVAWEAPATLPSALWRVRFGLLKTELAQTLAARFEGADEAVHVGNESLEARTPAQWRADADRILDALWRERGAFASLGLAEDDWFLLLEKRDLLRFPSYFDLLVSQRLAQIAAGALPAADKDVESSVTLAEAVRIGGRGREAARGFWRLEQWSRARAAPPPPESGGGGAESETARAEAAARQRAILEAALREIRAREAQELGAALLAEITRDAGDRAGAVAACGSVGKGAFAEARQRCDALRSELTRVVLEGSGLRAAPGAPALQLRLRNIETLWLRVYAAPAVTEIPPSESVDEAAGRALSARLARASVLKSERIELKPPAKHADVELERSFAGLAPGRYHAVASTEAEPFAERQRTGKRAGNALHTRIFPFQISRIAPVASAYRDEKEARFHAFVLDAETGAPVPGAELSLEARRKLRGVEQGKVTQKSKVGPDGKAAFAVSFPPGSGYAEVQAKLAARSGADLVPLKWELTQQRETQSIFRVSVDVDRPLYRLGDVVQGRVQVLRASQAGFQPAPAVAVELRLTDPSGRELWKGRWKPDAHGAAHGSMTVPGKGMLGSYQLSASLPGAPQAVVRNASFQIEDFRKPEFEIRLEGPASARFGTEAEITARVRTYSGAPIANARVVLTVVRESELPWFASWWTLVPRSRPQTVSVIEIRSNTEGTASAKLPLLRDAALSEPLPARFTIAASVTDASGNTESAMHVVAAAASAAFADLGENELLLDAGASSAPEGSAPAGSGFPVALRSLDGSCGRGKGRLSFYRLDAESMRKVLEERGVSDQGARLRGFGAAGETLTRMFSRVPDGPSAGKLELDFNGSDAQRVSAPRLPAGIYRARLTGQAMGDGEEARAAEMVFVVTASDIEPTLSLPSVTLVSERSPRVGDDVDALVGGSHLRGLIVLEVTRRGRLLEERLFVGGGLRRVRLPVRESMRGGAELRWWSVHKNRIEGGSVPLAVRAPERALRLEVQTAPVWEPGGKARLRLRLSDAQGKLLPSATGAVRVYDRALDALAHNGFGPSFDFLAPLPSTPQSEPLGGEKGWAALWSRADDHATAEEGEWTWRPPPALRATQNLGRGYGRAGGVPVLAMSADAQSESADAVKALSLDKRIATAPPAHAPPPSARERFADTAAFVPLVFFKGGEAQLSFPLPEQLASWQIEAFALDARGALGRTQAAALARKDLAVRLDLPRFLRSGDKVVLQAFVETGPGPARTGSAELKLKSQTPGWVPEFPAQRWSAAGEGRALLRWNLEIPRGVQGSLAAELRIRSGAASDAESRSLNVLPATQILAVSDVRRMGSAAADLRFNLPPLASGGTAQRGALIVEPQIGSALVHALSALEEAFLETTDSLVQRLVPFAVANALLKEFPALPKPAAPEDPSSSLRLVGADESPWVRSQELPGSTSLLHDRKRLEREWKALAAKLAERQAAEGGFAWFPGGAASEDVTVAVMEVLAEAVWAGADLPEAQAERAFRYLAARAAARAKETARDEAGAHADARLAYVLGAFPLFREASAAARPAARALAERAEAATTPLSRMARAQLALFRHRNGEASAARAQLAAAFDGARDDPATGLAWAPGERSWLWYRDSIATHALVMRAASEMDAADKRVDGLGTWLLFQRKAGTWAGVRETSTAALALLRWLKGRGDLPAQQSWRLDWGARSLERSVSAKAAGALVLELDAKALREAQEGPRVRRSKGQGFAFASATRIDEAPFSQNAENSPGGILRLSGAWFVREQGSDGKESLRPLKNGGTVKLGALLEQRIELEAQTPLARLHVLAPRPAGVEPEMRNSAWNFAAAGRRYEDVRESATHVFLEALPQGKLILGLRARPTKVGRFAVGRPRVQSLESSDLVAQGTDFFLQVEE